MTDTLTPASELAAQRRPLFPGESADYAAARQALLAEEIELRRGLERVAGQRRALPPGPVIEKDYRFLDAEGRNLGLADLFGPHDTLVTFYWMFGAKRQRPCPMCTNMLGPWDANAADIAQRVSLKIIASSPVSRQLAFGRERGWRNLEFLQTVGDDYARDIGALAADGGAEMGQGAVYRKGADGQVRLFWGDEIDFSMADPGQDPRAAPEMGSPLWSVLDLTPAGRDPKWYPKLSY
jgi:predicted dithiol-disulfide oxidoreductase (DUF899 family)